MTVMDRLNASLEKWLPEQRLFLRSDDTTRFVRLRPVTQMVGISGITLVFGWTLVASSFLVIDAVTDQQILDAQKLLAGEVGIFVEPASAAGVAGLLQQSRRGLVPAGATIAITVTGNGLKDKPKGTGLGLTICRQIVEHFGGRIWAEDARLGGAAICFTLPAARPLQAEVRPAA